MSERASATNLLYLARILRSKTDLSNILRIIGSSHDPILLGAIAGIDPRVLRRPYVPEDLEALRLLVSECHLSLDRELLVRLLNRRGTIINLGGDLFCIEDVQDLYHASMCYEKQTLAFIEHNVRQDGLFVDVGANIGGYTVRLSKKSKVYAFEPNLRNYCLLCSNLKLNNQIAMTYNYAVSDVRGKVELYISEWHGGHSITYRAGNKHYEVQAIRLDDILGSEADIDVLKVDVEGAEPNVLRGAAQTLVKSRSVVIECSTPRVAETVHKSLEDLGFGCVHRFGANHIFEQVTMHGQPCSG